MTLHHRPCQARWSRHWSLSSYSASAFPRLPCHCLPDSSVSSSRCVGLFGLALISALLHLAVAAVVLFDPPFVGLRPAPYASVWTPRHGLPSGLSGVWRCNSLFLSGWSQRLRTIYAHDGRSVRHARHAHARGPQRCASLRALRSAVGCASFKKKLRSNARKVNSLHGPRTSLEATARKKTCWAMAASPHRLCRRARHGEVEKI